MSAFSGFSRASKQASTIVYLSEKRPELSQTTNTLIARPIFVIVKYGKKQALGHFP
jgi:hypothetical protein